MSIFYIGLVLGMFSSLIGLGNMLFGSYARSLWGSTFRILLVTAAACIAPLTAGAFWAFPDVGWIRISFVAFGFIGFLKTALFFFPYQWGIKRVNISSSSSTELADGVILNEYEVALPAATESTDSHSCLIISDLHCNDRQKLATLEQAISRLLEFPPPDFIFHLGDFGENSALLPDVIQNFSRLKAKYASLCVLGNHDCEGGRRLQLQQLLGAHDIQLLEDELFTCAETGINILGLMHPWTRQPLPELSPAGFVICLTHTPDNIIHFEAMNVNIGFAGHTHGGKLRLPFVGAVLVPGKLGRFLDRGWFRLRDALLYLTPGIGYFPGKGGNLGEIALVTIQRE